MPSLPQGSGGIGGGGSQMSAARVARVSGASRAGARRPGTVGAKPNSGLVRITKRTNRTGGGRVTKVLGGLGSSK